MGSVFSVNVNGYLDHNPRPNGKMVASIHLPKYTIIITLMNISRVKVVRVGGKGNLGCRKTLFFGI